jgi:hypothetical protein
MGRCRLAQKREGKALGYGTIIVAGTGGTKEPFKMIAKPLDFRRQVQQQIASANQ